LGNTNGDSVRAAYCFTSQNIFQTSYFCQNPLKNCDNKTVKANKSEEPAELHELYTSEKLSGIRSPLLDRIVEVEVFLPVNFSSEKKYPLLVLNDGQDSAAVGVLESVQSLVNGGSITEIIVAAVAAGDRLQEYGVAARNDYKGRGKKAKSYTRYVTTELVPYLIYRYPVDPDPSTHAIAGYSLGGLSAIDIAWNHPNIFTKVGVFSGSFWWRKRDAQSRFYSDNRDRLMHLQIRKGKFKPGMKFWFQTGTRDELSDRNENGVIDSIDDTLDLVAELTTKGYRPFKDIQYLEIKNGEHNQATWAEAMPYFLKWAFGKQD
jgi:enterochelin esterase-like enzyme